MQHVIYVEKKLKSLPRTVKMMARFSERATVIECEHYREVFNPKGQDFRLQKQNPALILAEKLGQRVLPTPKSFGIGGLHNYYFSHMLNCLYDCRYCFLQGMYPSAHYVVFVNYEDFMQDILATLEKHPGETVYFFSGYDADSLAYEPVTHFLAEFLPFFSKQAKAILELRTKSANVQALMKLSASPNVVVAFSFTPAIISKQVEHRVPSVEKRILSMQRLAEQGWPIGLRFDPLIYAANFEELYRELIEQIFLKLDPKAVHSVSVGPLRFPEKMYAQLTELYPEDKLLAHPLARRDKIYTYHPEKEQKMKDFVLATIENYLPKAVIFECMT